MELKVSHFVMCCLSRKILIHVQEIHLLISSRILLCGFVWLLIRNFSVMLEGLSFSLAQTNKSILPVPGSFIKKLQAKCDQNNVLNGLLDGVTNQEAINETAE